MMTLPGEGKYVGNVSYYIPDEKATKELRSQLNSSNLSGRKMLFLVLLEEIYP